MSKLFAVFRGRRWGQATGISGFMAQGKGGMKKNCSGKNGMCLIPQIFLRYSVLNVGSWFAVLRVTKV